MSDEPQAVEVAEGGEVESRASRMGWVPQDKFRGNPDKWVDAESFVKRADEELPILRERNKALDTKYARLEREIAETRQTLQEFAEYHKNMSQREYQRALRDLQKQEREAVSLGNTGQFDAIQVEKQELEKLKPTEVVTPVNKVSESDKEAFNQWKKDAPWFGKDRVMTAAAREIANDVERENPQLLGSIEFYQEVESRIREEFPQKFVNAKRREPGAVHGEGSDTETAGASGKKKSYNDLPKEAKDACDRFVKQKVLTREDYVKEYFAGE